MTQTEIDSIVSELCSLCASDSRDGEDRSPFLESNRPFTRELGEKANQIGGYQAMLYVYQRVPRRDQLELQYAWDGIGNWLC